MQNIKTKIKLLHPEAKIPTYGSDQAAAFDLYSTQDITIEPGKIEIIQTGISMEIPEGYCIKFRDRSGLASKGITSLGGLIDSDYRGEFKVMLHNTTQEPFKIEKGDRIIQAVPTQVIKAEFEQAEELSTTKRGQDGFGSTGK